MADSLVVDSARHLAPIGDLDPVQNVAPTDAGLTPCDAIAGSLERLPPGPTTVVIGAAGLGHVAIPILRAPTATTVFGLVAVQPTVDPGQAVLRSEGHQVVVGGTP